VDRAEEGGLTPGVAGRVVFVTLAVLVFIVDRVTKGLVSANIPPGTEQQVLPFLWIANTQNSGAAFGLGRNATFLFLGASIVIAVILIVYAVRNRLDAYTGAVLGLVLGGTVGNGYDRLVHGQVTDFMALHWWPVFNVADSAITVGMILLILGYLVRHRHDSSE
jgi:signal peptidase II